jgi:hypothetical protein
MDNASKNAKDMIDTLQTKYNRGRQAAITNELVDIITGKFKILPLCYPISIQRADTGRFREVNPPKSHSNLPSGDCHDPSLI